MDRKVFYIIAAFLFIMWISIMVLFFLKADEVTKDPCSVCAKRMGENVTCTLAGQGFTLKRTYTPDLLIFDDA